MLEDVKCPKCCQNHMRTHSILFPTAKGTEVRYEWECMWCGHHEGNYKTIAEAEKDYKERIGGSK